jgi:UMF1 family MFS transporter
MALQVEIAIVCFGMVALLGMSQSTICYFWPYDLSLHGAVWNGPVFRTLPDLVFIVIGTVNYICLCANFSSSRTMLTLITPSQQSGTFFGVYALSGVATSWLAPTLVHWGTRLTQSQKGGFATILLLFIAGIYGLSRVGSGTIADRR